MEPIVQVALVALVSAVLVAIVNGAFQYAIAKLNRPPQSKQEEPDEADQ